MFAAAIASPRASNAQSAAPNVEPVRAPTDRIVFRDGSATVATVTGASGDTIHTVATDGTLHELPRSLVAQIVGPGAVYVDPYILLAHRPNPSLLATNAQLLRPGPGRARVEIESNGDQQTIGIPIGLVYQQQWDYVRRAELCTTPCTLYLAPGAYDLYSSGPGVVSATGHYVVPADGARFRLHARWEGWTATGGVAFGGGMIATIYGWIRFGQDFSVSNSLAPGIVLVGLGAVLVTGALIAYYRLPTGVASVQPLTNRARASHVRWALSPSVDAHAGGATIVGTF